MMQQQKSEKYNTGPPHLFLLWTLQHEIKKLMRTIDIFYVYPRTQNK
jgi:hypothetical protein